MQSEIKARFEAALESFVNKVKKDSNVRAVVLYGSLANDTVWEKSDMDINIIMREVKQCTRSFCVEEDGIVLNVDLVTEFDFKRGLERNPNGDWNFSIYSGARVAYAKEESFADFLNDFKQMGADDRALAFFQTSTYLIGDMEKIEKWLTVKKDPQYAQLWCLKATEQYANMRLILDNKPASREAVLKVMAYAPEKIKHLYEKPMQGFLTAEEVWEMLKYYKEFLIENTELLKQPVASYMADGGARTVTTLVKHFGMCSHSIYHIFDFLEEMGVVARVTESVRFSSKSKNTFDEIAFMYLEEME
jgi:predicted nucleotidyltransferase